jgi:hypothetical protein
MSNHLIIGLGGTGGKVIRNIRKAIYRDWRPSKISDRPAGNGEGIDKVAQATPPGLRIDYLYVDSSKEHMGHEDKEWKVLGENLQLDPSGQCHLEGGNLKTRLEDIHGYPALAPWIGSEQSWRSVLNLGTGGTEVLGGQKRRLGRFLFAANASRFIEKVNQKTATLKQGASTGQIQFHIVSGLAGGTGSGSLIDAICSIRKEYPDSKAYPIMLYLLLPEEHPKQGWNTGNYHANGYAALMELNALGVGAYMPYNLLGHGERHQNLPAPFKICYLVTNENNSGAPFEVDNQIPSLMAEMVYQTLMAETMAKQINRVVEWENMEISHEGKNQTGGSERCRIFASFGIKKISYPEEEIKEFIGYSLSAQTILQMLYNNWAQGYLDEEARDLAVEGLVGDNVTQKKLCLDRDVFFLERQFSSEDLEKDQKAWKPFEADWRAYIERLSSDIVSGEGNWLEVLKRKCEDREKKSFRDGRGVIDYYSWKMDRLQEYGRLVTCGIEDDFSKALLSGDRSLSEIEAILRSLCGMLDKKLAEWGKQIEDDSSHAAKQRILWTDNLQRFEDLGPLARRLPGNKDGIFEAGKNAMITYFSLTTRVSAWDFAAEFLRVVRNDLLRIADHVGTAIAGFRTAVRYCSEQASANKPEEKNLQSTEVVMRLFNGDEVTRYVASLIGNKAFQDKQARQAREKMVDKLMAGRIGLRTLPTAQDNGKLLDILAQSSHETLAAFDAAADSVEKNGADFGKLLSVSIIDKLRERYAGDPELMKREIRDHMGKAGYLLRINEAEHGKRGPGTDFGGQNKKTNLIVMLPDADKDDEFIKELKKAFQGAVGDPQMVQFIDTKDKKRHEITILSFVQLFPLRYVNVLGKLKESYESRLKDGDAKQRILELHTEDPSERFRPLLVPPVKEIVGPSVLLGMSLGSVRPKTVGGVAGTIKDELTTVDSENYPVDDLGSGFEGAISRCALREIHDRLTTENYKRVRSLKGNTSSLDDVREKTRALAREIAGDDDDAMKAMRACSEAAISELDGHLASIKTA